MVSYPNSAFSPQHEWNYHFPPALQKSPLQVSFCGQPLLTAPFPTLDQCLEPVGGLLQDSPAKFVDEVERSGLRGRGGAGLPLGERLREYRQASAERKYVVCKRDEHAASAWIDRYMMESRPVAVLLGMLAAGFACGAELGLVFVSEEEEPAIQSLAQAIEALYDWGMAGDHLLGTSRTFHFQMISLPEERGDQQAQALLPGMQGQQPQGWLRSPEHARAELKRRPALIQNAETLANLYYVAALGAEGFRRRGTRRSPGTKLLVLEDVFHRPGLYEVEMGTPLQQLVIKAGGLEGGSVRLRVGGTRGKLFSLREASSLRVDYESFSREGLLLGRAAVLGA